MKLWTRVLTVLVVSALIFAGCQSPTEPTGGGGGTKASTISGRIIRDDNNQPIAGAIVVDKGTIGALDTSRADGSYALHFNVSSTYSTTVFTTALGFFADSTSASVDPGATTTLTVRMKRDSSVKVIGALGPAATIVQVGLDAQNISLRGTGQNQSALVTFEVRDSLGNPLVGANSVLVKFSILGGPGGGEYVYPTSATTDPTSGRVSTRVTSGDKAGVLQINASCRNDSVRSSPTKITIAGGLPDANHFSMSLEKRNVAGLLYDGVKARFSVLLGDRYGNPAQQSAVYFTTTGGLITASQTSDASGAASVELTTTNPRPTNGIVWVTATTIGDTTVRKSDSTISSTARILFTGTTTVNVPTTPLNIPDSGSQSFSYRVMDPNGWPLVGGSEIKVSVTGPGSAGLELSGDVDVKIPDTQDTSFTRFNVTVSKNTRGGTGGPFTVLIDVKSDASSNGNGTLTNDKLTGYTQPGGSTGGGGTGGFPTAYSIEFLAASRTSLVVNEGGSDPASLSTLTFVVKDSAGSPIVNFTNSGIPRTIVMFSIPGGGLSGGEFLTPSIDSTDNAGRVSSVFHAGTKSGPIRILATIYNSGKPPAFADLIISGGYPDAARITTGISSLNMPGLVKSGVVGTVSLQVSDQYNNPARQGSLIYFTTSGGAIQSSATTDATGQASAVLYGGGQAPNDPTPGYGNVQVMMYGRDSTKIQKAIPFLFSGSPRIRVPSAPTDSVVVFDGSAIDLSYIVDDVNGNPLASGNTVTAVVSGPAASGVTLGGDVSVTTPETQDPNRASFKLRVVDAVSGGGATGTFYIDITANGPNGYTSKRLYGDLRGPSAITPPSPTVRFPAQIAFVGVSANDIYVSGVGALENSVVTYEVRDSLGAPIPTSPRYAATFSLTFFPNTWAPPGTNSDPRVIPGLDSTDDQARLRASVVSGSQAGVIQLVASIDLGGGKIVRSLPVKITVHAGFPDQKHFTIAPKQFNFPGLERAYLTLPITVQVADRYSNPVQAGTAVYFNTSHGTIQTGGSATGLTDADGFVTKNLFSANPWPEGADTLSIGPGWNYVYARTLGDNGTEVIDSLRILWTGHPVFTNVVGPATFTIANGGSAGPWTFTISDIYGHPMAPGTTISVTGNGLLIDGNANLTMPDTQFGGAGLTNFTVSVSDADPATAAAPPAKSTLTVTVTHPVYGTYTLILATGTVQ